jgi:ABC-type transporter Mla subunit MlaD
MPKIVFLAVAIVIVASTSCSSAIAQTSQAPSAQKPQRDAVLAALQKHSRTSGVTAGSVSKNASHPAKITQARRDSQSVRAQRFARVAMMPHRAPEKARAGASAAGKALMGGNKRVNARLAATSFAAVPKRSAHSFHARSSAAQPKIARKLPASALHPKRPG